MRLWGSREAPDSERHVDDAEVPGLRRKHRRGDVLQELGTRAAFENALADFSGITTTEALALSHVFQQATVQVDEDGTRDAAASAVVARGSVVISGPPLVFAVAVDRPFFVAIRDVPTSTILFMGAVVDPTL